MKNKVTFTHFLPLIGPFIIAVEELKKEGYGVETQNIVSYAAFKANQQHIERNNYGKVHYLPESMDHPSIEEYKKYIKENNFPTSDIVTAVPVCSGLSLMNASTGDESGRGGEAAQNDWIYETVKYYLASESKVLLLENAPGLIGAQGLIVLGKIRSILDDHEKGYKMHLTKTTTLNHGLPQDRRRTFLYIYKSKNYKVFKNLNRHKPILLENFLKEKGRPDQPEGIVNHSVIEDNYGREFYKYVSDSKLADVFHEEAKDKDILVRTGWQIIMPLYNEGKINLDEYPLLKKTAEKNKYKMSLGKSFWDGSPVFYKGKINGIIGKNIFRAVHPYYDRYFTVREHMDLMGLPNDFILEDQTKTVNHICQSVPITTASDHIIFAIGIIEGDTDITRKDDYKDDNIGALIQDNSKNDLEHTFKTITSDFKKVLDVKQPKANFYELF